MLPGSWDGTHEDRVWPGPPTIRLHVFGTSFAVLRNRSFSDDAAEGWYVNLEAPWRRTKIGFDSCDLVLDVVPAPDLSSWSWKDRDELDWSVEQGKFSQRQADQILREGERAGASLVSGEFPFVEDWSAWRPEETWSVPQVPSGWDNPWL
jgi:predicted RNA-binding protein associated with RNAse of E/G family